MFADDSAPTENPVATIGRPNGNQKRKSDAFLNISFPTADGGAMKLGFVTFTAANGEEDAQIIEHLRNADEKQLNAFRDKLILSFNLARTEPRKLAL